MQKIDRKYINWEKTAKNLKLLRMDNMNLRRYVCRELKYQNANCSGKCETCRFDMDNRISQSELASVFNVSESMIVNWENFKSRPSLEDLIFYSELCRIDLYDVIIFETKERR